MPTLLTVFTTVRGPDLPIDDLFGTTTLADPSYFGSALYWVADGQVVGGEPLNTYAGFEDQEQFMHASIPVEPGANHVAATFFDNPNLPGDIAAKYALVGAGSPNLNVNVIPTSVIADVGALMNCFLVDPESETFAPLADQDVDGWNPETGIQGYIAVPEGYHAVCEQIAETSLLSVRKIVWDLVYGDDGEAVFDENGEPVVEQADPDLTANWVVRVTAELPQRENGDGGVRYVSQQFLFPSRGRNWEAEGALPEYIKLRPGVEYIVEVLAPNSDAFVEFFEPVTSFQGTTSGVVIGTGPESSVSAPWNDAVLDAQQARTAMVAGINGTQHPLTAIHARAGAGEAIATWRGTPQPLQVIEVTAVSRPRILDAEVPTTNVPGPVTTAPTVTITPEAIVTTGATQTGPAATVTPTRTQGSPAAGNRPTGGGSQIPTRILELARTGAGSAFLVLLGGFATGTGLVLASRRRNRPGRRAWL